MRKTKANSMTENAPIESMRIRPGWMTYNKDNIIHLSWLVDEKTWPWNWILVKNFPFFQWFLGFTHISGSKHFWQYELLIADFFELLIQ